MGILVKTTQSSQLTNLGNTAETVLFTIPAVSIGPGTGPLNISGVVNITPGAGATAITIRVRQASLTGPSVGAVLGPHTVAAGAAQSIPFGGTDTSSFPEQAAAVYVVTGQQTGGTAAGVVNAIDLRVDV